MAQEKRRTAVSRDREREPGAEEELTPQERLERAREREAEKDRERPITRELVEFETAQEGVTGEGLDASGTLPGSFGGTTGTAGHAADTQTPGSTRPGVRGINPEQARPKVGRRRETE